MDEQTCDASPINAAMKELAELAVPSVPEYSAEELEPATMFKLFADPQ